MHQYLDDWIIYGLKNLVVQHTTIITQLLENLGYLINWKKSEIQPSQTPTDLGCNFNLIEGRISAKAEWWKHLQELIDKFQTSTYHSAQQWHSLLSSLTSTETRSVEYAAPEGDPAPLPRELAAMCRQTVRSSPSTQGSHRGPSWWTLP